MEARKILAVCRLAHEDATTRARFFRAGLGQTEHAATGTD